MVSLQHSFPSMNFQMCPINIMSFPHDVLLSLFSSVVYCIRRIVLSKLCFLMFWTFCVQLFGIRSLDILNFDIRSTFGNSTSGCSTSSQWITFNFGQKKNDLWTGHWIWQHSNSGAQVNSWGLGEPNGTYRENCVAMSYGSFNYRSGNIKIFRGRCYETF
jgi:hypothetical protein